MLKACVPKAPVKSVIWIVKLKVPCAPGVPEMVTEFVVLALRERPVGNAPEEIDQEKGPTPPTEVTVLL